MGQSKIPDAHLKNGDIGETDAAATSSLARCTVLTVERWMFGQAMIARVPLGAWNESPARSTHQSRFARPKRSWSVIDSHMGRTVANRLLLSSRSSSL